MSDNASVEGGRRSVRLGPKSRVLPSNGPRGAMWTLDKPLNRALCGSDEEYEDYRSEATEYLPQTMARLEQGGLFADRYERLDLLLNIVFNDMYRIGHRWFRRMEG